MFSGYEISPKGKAAERRLFSCTLFYGFFPVKAKMQNRDMQTNDDKRKTAQKLYESGENLIDIADKLGVKESTLRSWKRRGSWVKSATQKTLQKDPEKKRADRAIEKELGEEAEHLSKNKLLTSNQKLFCVYYVTCFNATKAYQKAYHCNRKTAGANGYRLLKNAEIKKCIRELKQNRLNQALLKPADILQKYIDIAFADITDFVEFGQEEVLVPLEVTDEETSEPKTLKKMINVVKFRESEEVDGTLVQEIRQGKDGASIKLMDRQKALNWIAEHMDLMTEEQKARIEHVRAQTAAINKALTGEEGEIEDLTDLETDIYGED